MRESALALCGLMVAACGSRESTTTPPDAGLPEDTTRPTVVSISPADQALGVGSDATIVITFSEPMDLQSTQTALQSPDLSLSAAVLTWNPEGNVLTITPNQPFVYATGSDPATLVAKNYRITVSTVATDVHGNYLAETFMSSFHTRRLIQLPILADADLTGSYGPGSTEGLGTVVVGDISTNNPIMGFASFDITALPTGVRIESATLALRLDRTADSPAGLGPVMIDEAAFATLTAGFTAVPRRSLGALRIPASGTGLTTVDIRAALSDDSANRSTLGHLVQYRLYTALATNNNDSPDLYLFDGAGADTGPELDIKYSIE